MSVETTNLTAWDSIEDNLFSTLLAIKQVDGYNFTVREVVGWGTTDFPFRGQWPACGIAIGNESANDIFGTNMRRCRRDVGIEMWAQAKPWEPGKPIASRIYQQIIADLEKALFVDHTRGGYAEDTEILERQPASDSSAGLIGAFMRCQIIYRHQVGNLYTKM